MDRLIPVRHVRQARIEDLLRDLYLSEDDRRSPDPLQMYHHRTTQTRQTPHALTHGLYLRATPSVELLAQLAQEVYGWS